MKTETAAATEEQTEARAKRSAVAGATVRSRALAAVEVLAVFAACHLFLWRFSHRYRYGWLLILAWMLVSIVARGDSLEKLGLTLRHVPGAARWMAAGLLLGAVPLLVLGARQGRIGLLLPDALALAQFLAYFGWCALQQFALQSYVHNRLLDAAGASAEPPPKGARLRWTSLALGLIFGSLHLPNPVLTIATLAGGVVMGEVFVRYRNIWVLALGQALIGTTLLVALPDAWHHRLRVGPGFHWWELRRLGFLFPGW